MIREGAGNGDALLLSSGEVHRRSVRLSESPTSSSSSATRPRISRGASPPLKRNATFRRAARREEIEALKHKAGLSSARAARGRGGGGPELRSPHTIPSPNRVSPETGDTDRVVLPAPLFPIMP